MFETTIFFINFFSSLVSRNELAESSFAKQPDWELKRVENAQLNYA